MKFRPAFTLIEISIYLIIAAVLLGILFNAIKLQKVLEDKNVKYKYASVYNALDTAAFEMTNKDNTNPFVGVTGDPVGGFEKLCAALTEYINTEETNCAVSPIPDSVAYMTSETHDFQSDKPHFIALNGMKFYLSELLSDNYMPYTSRSYYRPEDPTFTLKFFMVYVDLNGKDAPQRPHSIVPQRKKTHPDVFAFAILPTGDAIPIGIAEYDMKYFSTQIAYEEDSLIYYTPNYSLHSAKHAAWNWYKNSSSTPEFKERVSFTYNDHIKKILLRNRSKLYNFNASGTYPETYTSTMFAKCKPSSGTALTVYDMCRILPEGTR